MNHPMNHQNKQPPLRKKPVLKRKGRPSRTGSAPASVSNGVLSPSAPSREGNVRLSAHPGRRSRLIKNIAFFMACQFVFLPVFMIVMLFYSPFFTRTRDMYVLMTQGTMTHQWMSNIFLPQSTIQQILAANVDQFVTAPEQDPNQVAAVQYNDHGMDGITLDDVSQKFFDGYLLVIRDASRVKLGTASQIGSQQRAFTSSIVSGYNAIAGINAGGFVDYNSAGVRGEFPEGILMVDGKLLYQDTGYTTYPVIGFNDQSQLIVNNGMTLDQINAAHMRDIVSFGPPLIVNGVSLVTGAGSSRQPRTAIGQTADGTVLLLVCDGRQ
ncbi:MAG: phosphodiester glycosidase family protein, partial [Oscillospiraceae bacterium]|nr:phosphodiester glycosidase family protein [Oscillospiraceae bacterium]